MSWIKSLLCSISLGIALSLKLAIALSTTVAIAPSTATELNQGTKLSISKVKEAKPKKTNPPPPPPPTNPDSSAAGGRRDTSACPQDAKAVTTSPLLTALSPTTKPGLTLAERPTFLVYVPKTSAKNAEFSLRSREGGDKALPSKTHELRCHPLILSCLQLCSNKNLISQFLLKNTALHKCGMIPPNTGISLYFK